MEPTVALDYECGECGCRFSVQRSKGELAIIERFVVHCPDCASPDNVVRL